MLAQLTITLPGETETKIREFAKQEDMSLSAVLRKGALLLIEKSE